MVRIKVKLSLWLSKYHAMKTYGRVEAELYIFLTSVIDVSFTLLPLYPQLKIPRIPLDRRLCGPKSRSEQCGEETFCTV
jgi:hypothetical protein